MLEECAPLMGSVKILLLKFISQVLGLAESNGSGSTINCGGRGSDHEHIRWCMEPS